MEFTVANILGIISLFLSIIFFFVNLVFALAFKLNSQDRQNIRDALQSEKEQRISDSTDSKEEDKKLHSRITNLENKQSADRDKIFNELSEIRELLSNLLGKLGEK